MIFSFVVYIYGYQKKYPMFQ